MLFSDSQPQVVSSETQSQCCHEKGSFVKKDRMLHTLLK